MVRKFVAVGVVGVGVIIVSLGSASTVGQETPVGRATAAVRQAGFSYPLLRDEASMLIVGTALIALAAALRRSA